MTRYLVLGPENDHDDKIRERLQIDLVFFPLKIYPLPTSI